MPSTPTPLDIWLSAFRAPLSGDVTQDIDPRFFSPNVTFDFAGDHRIEGRIVSRVASYGRQLDVVIKALQAVARDQGTQTPDLDRLADRIADEKSTARADLARNARESLTALREADPALYRQVLAEAPAADSTG